MPSSINRVILVGRLTRDPELRSLPSGTALCGLRLACNTVRKDAQGAYHDKPNFFTINVFGVQAETVSRYMRKGSRVAIDGRLEWGEWQTAEGARRQAVDVVAERVEFLDGPGSRDSRADGEGGETDDGDPGEELGREPVGVGPGIEDDVVF